jgi:hypothetical protein
MKLDIYSVNQIQYYHKGYWFSSDTMRFFKTRLCQEVWGTPRATFFISSEVGPLGYGRLYTVRCFDKKTGDISTYGEFQGHKTLQSAKQAAAKATR